VPYAIDFLNPAPDFERDRITQHYFELVLDRMAKLVIDRAVSGALTNPWPRWEEMTGLGVAAGVLGQPASGGTAVAQTFRSADLDQAAPPPRKPRARRAKEA
jgi:hypothetical protein